MIVVGIILTFLIGLSCLNLISQHFSVMEKFGLSFLVGLFGQTLLMLFMDMVCVELNRGNILIWSTCLLCLLNYSFILHPKRWCCQINFCNSKLPSLNLVWLLFVVLIFYLEYMNFAKCMYYPTFDRDSLAGFDTIGWIIAQEHTLHGLSIFNKEYSPGIYDAGSYVGYMPMLQLSYAYVYLLGAETSKLIPALVFLAFLVAFYGVTCRFIGHTGAAVTTFFVLITPEMIAFSSLSATNVVHAVYASLGVIYSVLWLDKRESMFWKIGALLLAGNLWVRNEGLVFIGAVWLVILIFCWKEKPYLFLLKYGFYSILPIIIWSLFMQIYGISIGGIIIPYLFWDSGKIEVIWNYFTSHWLNQQYYGLSFIACMVAFGINIWFVGKRKEQLALFLVIVLSMLFYMIILYQINYLWDSIEDVLRYSAKRFMFCFIPLLWLYTTSSYWGKKLFYHLEIFLNNRKLCSRP